MALKLNPVITKFTGIGTIPQCVGLSWSNQGAGNATITTPSGEILTIEPEDGDGMGLDNPTYSFGPFTVDATGTVLRVLYLLEGR